MAKAKKTTPEKLILAAEPRTVSGKAVKTLRKNGMIPANIFGSGFDSVAITFNAKEFQQTYKVAQETGIVYVHVNKTEYPTLIADTQRHPLNDNIMHVDMRKIDLSKKIETEVPIQIIGASLAVNQKGGVLITMSDHLYIEALPADIPQHIEIDISTLNEIGDEIKVSDLAKSDKYTIVEENDKVIVSVTAHKEESLIAETTPAGIPEITTAKAPEEGETAEAGTEKAPAKKEDKKE